MQDSAIIKNNSGFRSGGDENISDTEKNFPEKGLNTNKRLKLYDCWDEETKPE